MGSDLCAQRRVFSAEPRSEPQVRTRLVVA